MTDLTDLSGRDLDRAVAEAKGIPLEEHDGQMLTFEDVCLVGQDALCRQYAPIRRYSTDWAAAGPLLEEMAAAGLEPQLSFGYDVGPRVQVAWDRRVYDDIYTEYAIGDTGPEAIARAYVEWKAATLGRTATAASPVRP